MQIQHATNPPYSIAMRPVPGGSGLGTLCSASIFEACARLRCKILRLAPVSCDSATLLARLLSSLKVFLRCCPLALFPHITATFAYNEALTELGVGFKTGHFRTFRDWRRDFEARVRSKSAIRRSKWRKLEKNPNSSFDELRAIEKTRRRQPDISSNTPLVRFAR